MGLIFCEAVSGEAFMKRMFLHHFHNLESSRDSVPLIEETKIGFPYGAKRCISMSFTSLVLKIVLPFPHGRPCRSSCGQQLLLRRALSCLLGAPVPAVVPRGFTYMWNPVNNTD